MPNPVLIADGETEVLAVSMHRDGTLLIKATAGSEGDVNDIIDFLRGIRTTLQHRNDRAHIGLAQAGPA